MKAGRISATRPEVASPARPEAASPARRRLLVVDDQMMLLDVISRQLSDDPDLELVGTASEAVGALSSFAALKPDVVMLDVDLGGELSGFDVLRALRDAASSVPRVVMVSMFDNPMYRNRAFELGADAYATKGLRFATVRALLLDDRSYAAPDGDEGKFWRNAPEVVSGKAPLPFVSLTPRERVVVGKIVSGACEKEIAGQLGVSISSVNTFLRRAMAKLKVSTRAELLKANHLFR